MTGCCIENKKRKEEGKKEGKYMTAVTEDRICALGVLGVLSSGLFITIFLKSIV